MITAQIVMFVLKLLLGGAAAFLAMILWNKTGDGAWISIAAGIIVQFAGSIYRLLVDFGILGLQNAVLLGISVPQALFEVVPLVFFITGLLILIKR